MNNSTEYFSVEGVGTTVVHPIGLAMLVLCGAMLVVLPRRYSLWAFIVLICFVATRQCIVIAGCNLYFPRVMILVFGLGRVLMRGEGSSIRLNRLDVLVITYGVLYVLMGAINWQFDASVLKTRLGYVTESVGMYMLFRVLVRDERDVNSTILGMAVVSVPLLLCFVIERQTGRNLFAMFGGVPEVTAVRGGRLRCQGAFGHPILAGVFWASVMPFLVYGALCIRRLRLMFAAGVIAALLLVILTASSTPALGAVTGMVGWMLFPLRRYASHGFAVLGMLLIFLHLSMKAPVWSLIQRLNVTAGDSGYHRYILVDGFIRHMNEWWLMGSLVGTEHWGHFTFDTANQYISVGVSAGLPTLGVFIAIIVVAMKASGRIGKTSPMLGWAVGVSIFVVALCFLGISIWGQMHFAWSLPIALAGSLGFGRETTPRATVQPTGCGSTLGAPTTPMMARRGSWPASRTEEH